MSTVLVDEIMMMCEKLSSEERNKLIKILELQIVEDERVKQERELKTVK